MASLTDCLGLVSTLHIMGSCHKFRHQAAVSVRVYLRESFKGGSGKLREKYLLALAEASGRRRDVSEPSVWGASLTSDPLPFSLANIHPKCHQRPKIPDKYRRGTWRSPQRLSLITFMHSGAL